MAVPTTLVTVLALLGPRRSWRRLTAPQRAAIVIPLLAYPLVDYIVACSSRYAVRVSGILEVLAGAAVWDWIEARPPAS